MERFFQYVEQALPDRGANDTLYKFKRKTVDEMFARANELTARGLKDENVINDLIIDEYGDVVEQYKQYENEKRKKQFRKRFLLANIIGSVAYVLVLLILFFGISFSTHAWGQTWVIMVDGILLLIAYLLALGVNRVMDMRRMFHFIARILLAIDIVVVSVALFIFSMAILHQPYSWVIVFGGLFSMFLCDAVFATVTKQRLAIINWMIYIPAMGAMLYVILGALSLVSWSTGWLIILFAVVIDLIVALIAIFNNKAEEREVVDTWKES